MKFDPTLDGEIHTHKDDDFKGWYIGSVQDTEKGPSITLTVEDFREGRRHHFKEQPEGLTKKELHAVEARNRQEKEIVERKARELQESVAKRAEEEVIRLQNAQGDFRVSRYLAKKGLDKFAIPGTLYKYNPSIDTINLIIPMKDVEGRIWGFQSIDDDGQKCFLDGQKTDSLYHLIGKLDPNGVIYVVEGYATGVTIHATTGRTVAVAFNAFGLTTVGAALRGAYPNLRIVFCGDEDNWKLDGRGLPYRTGYKKSREAARLTQGSHCKVSFKDIDAKTVQANKPTDFNDLLLLAGADAVVSQIEDHFETAPHEYIPTEHTGFHDEITTKSGIKHEPNYVDLRDYFDRHSPHITLAGGKVVYVWTGEYYKKVKPSDLGAFADREFMIAEREVCTNRMASEFEGKVTRSNLKDIDWFYSTTEGMVNFNNGILDFHTGELTPRNMDRGFRNILEYDYDSNAQAPEFDLFMERLFPNDNETQLMLLEQMGYAISGDTYWQPSALLLVGKGSNGKSTYLRVIESLLNSDFVTSLTLEDLKSDQHRAALDGALVNLSEENEPDSLHKSEKFKNLSDGGLCRAKVVYEATYDFKNRAKFFFAFNEMPRSKDDSQGLSRRLFIAEFKADFEKQKKDPHILKKLKAERSGIFNKARSAYLEAKNRGHFTKSQRAKESLDQFQFDSNPVAQFAYEMNIRPWNGEKLPTNPPKWAENSSDGVPFVAINELHHEYAEWAKKHGYTPHNVVHFSRKLRGILGDNCPVARVMENGMRRRIVTRVLWCGELEA